MRGEMDHGLVAELIEVEAWADMMDAMPEETKAMIGGDCSRVDGALSISAKNIPLVTFNRVIGFGLEHAADPEGLADIVGYIRSHSAPVAQLQIAPFADLAGGEKMLSDAGFARAKANWAKMGRPSANPPKIDTDITVEPAGRERAEAFAATVLAGFGMPPFLKSWLAALPGRDRWHCYVALQDGEVIAGGALYLGGEAGWLGVAATLPTARKHGAQGALIARRIADAAALGKAWVYTETGILDGPNPSLANMYRTGFECLHERGNWTLNG
jgi:hypothetical protein